MLTACGIETCDGVSLIKTLCKVATVLTACGIETFDSSDYRKAQQPAVATVLTACGIETCWRRLKCNFSTLLQQCLPLAVLKHSMPATIIVLVLLQQCLPLAVLKLRALTQRVRNDFVLLQQCLPLAVLKRVAVATTPVLLLYSCNSAYRLRY